ncbi:hypothetical protein [Saccharospirillum sp.]|uniref:hypothetical protein n=1 Tax=Saccharospirillum sp. TaxID=2033801 RepID=UPI0034A0AC15
MSSKCPSESDETAHLRALWLAIDTITARFGFSEPEILSLLGSSLSSTALHEGLKTQNVPVKPAVKDRVSALLGIDQALQAIFSSPTQAASWIDRSNELPPFSGKTPRQLMLKGDFETLLSIRRFLDYWTT